jgi:hypothetical protein
MLKGSGAIAICCIPFLVVVVVFGTYVDVALAHPAALLDTSSSPCPILYPLQSQNGGFIVLMLPLNATGMICVTYPDWQQASSKGSFATNQIRLEPEVDAFSYTQYDGSVSFSQTPSPYFTESSNPLSLAVGTSNPEVVFSFTSDAQSTGYYNIDGVIG